VRRRVLDYIAEKKLSQVPEVKQLLGTFLDQVDAVCNTCPHHFSALSFQKKLGLTPDKANDLKTMRTFAGFINYSYSPFQLSARRQPVY
jgi:hypothetical protein